MKLLRSTFVAYCVASSASGFAPPRIPSRSLSAARGSASTIVVVGPSSTALAVGLHEQPASSISDEEIRREEMFVQVLKEVRAAKEYLGWLIEEQGGSSSSEEEEGTKETLAEAVAAQAAAGDVGLFGGGGDAPSPAAAAAEERETAYRPALRADLGSTVLLTGTADASLLAILNNNFFGQDSVPNFEFARIRALVEDPAAARKKAIGREARYSGLLDKLVIEAGGAGEGGGALPSPAELEGATSWIAEVAADEAGTALPRIGELAGGCAGLDHVVVLVTGASSSAGGPIEGWDALAAASADGDAFRCTLLAAGDVRDGGDEGGFCHVGPVGEEGGAWGGPDGEPPRLARRTAYRLAAHALSLESTAGLALAAREYGPADVAAVGAPYAEGNFAEKDEDGKDVEEGDGPRDVKMEGRVIQGMREMGFTQLMELDVLVGKGLSAFKEYLANPPERKKDPYSQRRAERDEEDERIMAKLDAEIAISEKKKAEAAAEQRRIEIEGIAKEWAIKEYSLRMLGGDLDESVSEKDFMVSTHEEAMAEAERTYERIHSEEYTREQERLEKNKVNAENKLFWEGMPPVLRKKREKMVEKVKKQYMDLLSEEDLERIILSE